MTQAVSLQRRLGTGLVLGVTIMWLVSTFAAGLVVRHELDEAFDSALQQTAQRLLSLAIIDILGRDAGAPQRAVTALGSHDESLTYLVRKPTGEVLLQSHDADPTAFPKAPAPGYRATATHRLYGEAAVSGTIIIEVAEPLAHRREATIEAAMALSLPLAFLIPISMFGVWWFVRQSMRPILAFKEEIETRGGRDLLPVSAEGLPTEISPIADAVNRLMVRLRRTLDAERSFTANSAHELRTPIAGALAQTQRLIAVAPEGEVRDRARQVEGSLRQLARVSEKLMQLAKAEGGGLLSETPHDLAIVLTHVAEEFQRSPGVGTRLRLSYPTAGAIKSHMDPDAFAILIRNLIENALKHGRPEMPVEISVFVDGVIRVVNSGKVVPPHVLARLKGRFERGATEAKGAGLGLAIAETIATGAGGRLDIASPPADRDDGFEVVLRLPD